MKIKELNKLWLDWNRFNSQQRFGQYVLNNSVVEHFLTTGQAQQVWNCTNSAVVYNTLLMVCFE